MLACYRLVTSRALGAVLAMRWPVVAVGGLLVLSAGWSADPTLTVKRAAIYALGLLALLAAVHSSERPVRLMMRTVVGFTAVVAIISIGLYVALPPAYTVNPARPGLAGISNHPNTLAPFLLVGLLLSLGMTPLHRVEAWLRRIGQGFLALALLLTDSMTTIATTAVGFGLFGFFAADRYRAGAMQLVAGTVVGLVLLVGPGTIKSELFEAAGRDESLSGRDELWRVVWHEAWKSPILGNGYGAFWTEGKGRELVQTWNPRQSHHAYLDVFVDVGAVGLIVVLLVFPCTILASWLRVRGPAGSGQRRAVAALTALCLSLLGVYAFGQSFIFKLDSFPFFATLWSTLLLSNPDENGIQQG
jgi:exopolysaccharide production protein ExoQ